LVVKSAATEQRAIAIYGRLKATPFHVELVAWDDAVLSVEDLEQLDWKPEPNDQASDR
jgi:hypothetical protein